VLRRPLLRRRFYHDLFQMVIGGAIPSSASSTTRWMIDVLKRRSQSLRPVEYEFDRHGPLQFLTAVLAGAPPDWPVRVSRRTTVLRELLLFGYDSTATVPRLFIEFVRRLRPEQIAAIGVRRTAFEFITYVAFVRNEDASSDRPQAGSWTSMPRDRRRADVPAGRRRVCLCVC
jgi:hypothetical protein